MNNEPVAIVELGGEITWLTDVLPYKSKLYTHPVKELTDEEMYELLEKYQGIELCKAVLRKAQEKC